MNESDEILLLAFLRRAREALDASQWSPASVGTLEMYLDAGRDHPNLDRRIESPALADLADEWDVKFRADFYTFLGADPEGKVPFHFRTFAHSEAEHWNLDGTPLHALTPFPIFGLYMIREGDRFRYGDFLENIFCYPAEPDGTPEDQYRRTPLQAFFDGNEGAEMCHTGDGWEGVDWADAVGMDSNSHYSERHTFAADAGDSVLSDLDPADLRTPENAWEVILDKLADQATEGAREWFQGNACHPRAVMEG